MYSSTTLIGRLGKDPELRHTANQTAVCNLWLATTEFTGTGETRKEYTEWHSVVVWQKLADHCHKFLRKGSLVMIEGRIASREYTDKEGVKRKQSEIVARTVKFLTPKEKPAIEENHDFPQAETKPLDQLPQAESWDDIPF